MSYFSVLERGAKAQTPCIRPAWDLNQLIQNSEEGKLTVLSWLQIHVNRKGIEIGQRFSLETSFITNGKGFITSKTTSKQKSEKYETWRLRTLNLAPKWVTRVRQPGFLSLLPGWAIVVSVWTKYLVTRRIKTGIHKLSIRTGQRNL